MYVLNDFNDFLPFQALRLIVAFTSHHFSYLSLMYICLLVWVCMHASARPSVCLSLTHTHTLFSLSWPRTGCCSIVGWSWTCNHSASASQGPEVWLSTPWWRQFCSSVTERTSVFQILSCVSSHCQTLTKTRVFELCFTVVETHLWFSRGTHVDSECVMRLRAVVEANPRMFLWEDHTTDFFLKTLLLCVWHMYVHATVPVWRADDSFLKSIFSFNLYVSYGDQTQTQSCASSILTSRPVAFTLDPLIQFLRCQPHPCLVPVSQL